MNKPQSGAVGFPVNMPANFAPGLGPGGYAAGPGVGGGAGMGMGGAAVEKGPSPNQLGNANNPALGTLYVRNLKEKAKPAKLKQQLRDKFKGYGEVVSVECARTNTMKGQAFVSFATVDAATAAKDALDGKELDGRAMMVQFAKAKSDRLAKKDGTYVKRQRRQEKKAAPGAPDTVMEPAAPRDAAVPAEEVVPHNILFVQNLPEAPEGGSSAEVFQRFAGYVETRMVPGKTAIAFVEFSTVEQASAALQELQNSDADGKASLKITYAKR